MRRLGEILLERGAIAVSELHTGLEACRRTGGRLGTQLLRFGFVDEKSLLTALAEQYGVPSVSADVVARSPLAVRRTVPVDTLKRIQAVPFLKTASSLSVAMINPRDPLAVDELAQRGGLPIEVHVATEVAVAEALAEVDDDLVRLTVEKVLEAPTGDVPDEGDWSALWGSPSAAPRGLFGGVASGGSISPRVHVASFPASVGLTLPRVRWRRTSTSPRSSRGSRMPATVTTSPACSRATSSVSCRAVPCSWCTRARWPGGWRGDRR